MSIRNLGSFFNPASVAVIGASQKALGIGATVLRNLMQGQFKGEIFPVNPKYATIGGLKTYGNLRQLPAIPELALICTPPATVPRIVAELGARGAKAAILFSPGLNLAQSNSMLAAAKPHLLRILGPDSIGLLVPGIGLNASLAHIDALPGKLAFVSQSGALAGAVLDWAKSRAIGFSKFVTLGESADVDLGDLLDYLASDADTHAILLYLEGIRDARKFMSAARSAARSKPVLVLKAGRSNGAGAGFLHSGALAHADAIYDCAIRRAGMLRVFSTEDLFGAVQTLARAKPLNGEHLTILSNGAAPGLMACDALIGSGGTLSALGPDTVRQLAALVPGAAAQANPLAMARDATPERYRSALGIVLQDAQADAVLMLHAPSALVSGSAIANATAALVQSTSRNVISCWLGGDGAAPARQLLAEAGSATYDTPEEAVAGFMQMVQYHRNQRLLMQVPPSLPVDVVPDRRAALALVQGALANGQSLLSDGQTKTLLAAYGIALLDSRSAATPEQAVLMAQEIGFPVALKIVSPELSHKTEVGGVVLDLDGPPALLAAAQAMQQRLHALRPDATLKGFVVQAMARRPDAVELILGVATDPVFGPVLLFGQGGIGLQVMADTSIGLPPLNLVLARDMIARTRVAGLLAGYRNRPAADLDAIGRTLIALSHLVSDIAEIAELDLHPLLADASGVLVLDARVRLARPSSRMAIRPYPAELEETLVWQGQPLLLRPIQPEDGAAHIAFFNALDPEDVRFRMFIRMRELQPAQLARLTQIDYDRDMAFIATRMGSHGQFETLGVVRAMADPDHQQAEFAISVRSDLKGRGLGSILMTKLVAYCRSRGMQEIVGEALPQNSGILNLVKRFGFDVRSMPEDGVMLLRLNLRPKQGA